MLKKRKSPRLLAESNVPNKIALTAKMGIGAWHIVCLQAYAVVLRHRFCSNRRSTFGLQIIGYVAFAN
jgi:hypothetical protein